MKVGDRFARLVVIGLIPDAKNPKAKCLCDCGNVVTPQRGALRNGRAKSCGCLRVETFTAAQAGRSKMPEEEAARRRASLIDAWHQRNGEKNRAASRKFYANNKSKVKVYHHERRARVAGALGRPSVDIESRLMRLQRGKCGCCRKPLAGVKHHLDHVTPLARGGSNRDDNFQLLCATCNLQKGAKDPIDFMQRKGFLL